MTHFDDDMRLSTGLNLVSTLGRNIHVPQDSWYSGPLCLSMYQTRGVCKNAPNHVTHCGWVHVICHAVIVERMGDHEKVEEVENPKWYNESNA